MSRKVKFEFDVSKLFYLLVGGLIVGMIAVGVYAYNSGINDPSVMGHSLDELEGVQERVAGNCAVGSSIRAINANGTVQCEADDVGGNSLGNCAWQAGLGGNNVYAGGSSVCPANRPFAAGVIRSSWWQGGEEGQETVITQIYCCAIV